MAGEKPNSSTAQDYMYGYIHVGTCCRTRANQACNCMQADTDLLQAANKAPYEGAVDSNQAI